MLHHPSLCIIGCIMWSRICLHLPLPLLHRNRYSTGVSTDKNLRTTHPFLHSFVSSFLIPPPGVTSPRGGSSDQGLRRGYFTRAAKRMPAKRPSEQIIALEIFSRDGRVKGIWKLKTDILLGRINRSCQITLRLSIKFLTRRTILALLSFLHLFSIRGRAF